MIGVSIKYTGSDGRSYPDAASMLKAGVVKVVDEHFTKLERAAQAPVCPVHHQHPTVRRTGSGDNISFGIEACCEELAAKAQAAISG